MSGSGSASTAFLVAAGVSALTTVVFLGVFAVTGQALYLVVALFLALDAVVMWFLRGRIG